MSNPMLAYPAQSYHAFGTKVLVSTNQVVSSHHTALLIGVRGGGSTEGIAPALDMSREMYNIGALASYGVVTALILNCVVDLCTGPNFNNNPKQINSSFSRFFSISSSICIASGLLAGVLFHLVGIYSRSGIEIGNIEGYRAFQSATVGLSRIAFCAFLLSFGSFVSAFLVSLHNVTKEGGKLGNTIFYLVSIISVVGGILICQLQNLASTHILAPAI